MIPATPQNVRVLSGRIPQPPPPPPSGDQHAYYESLIARPELFISNSLRDQAALEPVYKGSEQPSGRQLRYDYANDPDPRRQDAAKFTLPENAVSIQAQDSLFIPFKVTEGDYIITWDTWIGREWSYDNRNGNGPQIIARYKNFQIRRQPGDGITDETRTNFIGMTLPAIARVDGRYYPAAGPYGPNVTDEQPLAPQLNEFEIQAETWTRYWLRLQLKVGGYNLHSLWLADPARDAVQIFDQLQLSPFDPSVFQLQCNTSTHDRIGPELVMYYRNIVILNGVGHPERLPMVRPT